MLGCPKFTYETLNQTAQNRIAWKWTMQSQTKTCIAKSSCEICALLRYYAAESGNSIPTFQDNLLIPNSRAMKSKRENRAELELTDTFFFTSSIV
jgi:hypothetical protein